MKYTEQEREGFQRYYGFEYDCDCPICEGMMEGFLEGGDIDATIQAIWSAGLQEAQ